MSFVIQNMVNNCELQLILTYPGFFCDGTRRYFLKKALYFRAYFKGFQVVGQFVSFLH